MKKKPVIRETYYAVQIGVPFRRYPYLMTDRTGVPQLFHTRVDAENAVPNQPSTKAVRVHITTG